MKRDKVKRIMSPEFALHIDDNPLWKIQKVNI